MSGRTELAGNRRGEPCDREIVGEAVVLYQNWIWIGYISGAYEAGVRINEAYGDGCDDVLCHGSRDQQPLVSGAPRSGA